MRLIILCILACFCTAATATAPIVMEAPFINSKAVKERFASITAQDMDLLRQKKILFCSRSFGLNIRAGLERLATQNPSYQLLGSYQRFDVFKAGGDLGIIPADVFQKVNFVHFLCTHWPYTKRVEEMDTVLRSGPHTFSAVADAVIVLFDDASAATFEPFVAKLEAWRRDFPRIYFIGVTGGLMGPVRAKDNAASHAFGELLRAKYRGNLPIYDMAAIESDDFRVGTVFCPEYSTDPAGVHPNTEAGMTMLAKGFLLVLRDAFRMPVGGPAARKSSAKIPSGTKPAPVISSTETLPIDHPEYRAVRAILDANGLTAKKVEGVSAVRGGHVVALYLNEGGVVEIPDAIGDLPKLEILYVYGDRTLSYPLLRRVSPAIGRCSKLNDLLLNNNELTTLPEEIASLRAITKLSVGDNRLHNLSPAVSAWLKRLDPAGLENQRSAQP